MLEIINSFLFNNTPLLYLTQSLWRDEAFSVFISKSTIGEIIRLTGGDFNPPLYYLLLHGWIKVFGDTAMALRMFSFVTFVLLVLLVYTFAQKVFTSQFAIWVATLLTLTNPMLLYFAFELRMYALLALMATASMYFLFKKKWLLYSIATAAGLYAQPFMVFVLVAQFFYVFFTKQIRVMIKPWLITGVLFLPWLPTLIRQFAASTSSWIYPVDVQLIRSVAGNVFVGYEGTPVGLWNITTVLSIFFIALAVLLIKPKKRKLFEILVVAWTFIPLLFVMGISLIKPIYVHRYLIFVTVGEIFLIASFVQKYAQKPFIKLFGVGFIVFFAAVNIYAAPFHAKTDYNIPFQEIAAITKDGDVIYAETPLNYFESLYYAPDSTAVFLYNPSSKTPPVYTGGIGMPANTWRTAPPQFPDRAFLIHENGAFDTISTL